MSMGAIRNRIAKAYRSLIRAITQMSIRRKMSLTYSVVFVILFLLQLLIYSALSSDIVRTMANNYMTETLRQTSGKIDAAIDQINVISKNIVSDTAIRDVLVKSANLTEGQQMSYADTEAITSELSKLTLAYDGINSIQIYTPTYTVNYNFVSHIENYQKLLTLAEKEQIDASRGQLVLMPAREEFTDKLGRERTYVFSAIRKFIDYRFGTELGYVFINVDERVLKHIISPVRIGIAGKIQIFGENKRIVSTENDLDIGTPIEPELMQRLDAGMREGFFISKDQHVVVFSVSEKTGWGTMTRVKRSEVNSAYGNLQLLNFLIGVIGILIASLLSIKVSKALTKPLSELVTTMHRIQEGDLSARAKIKNNDEVGNLAQVFNQMTTDMHALIQQYYEGELAGKESELKAMQAQISPHFLYNSLDSVYWMLVLRGQHDVADIIVSLCEILRYSIQSDPGVVSLGKEIEMGKHYLSIQRARFGTKLAWQLPEDAQMLSLSVPKMILQPLLENAIVHGMDPQKECLHIQVRTTARDSVLEIAVADDGCGMSPEKLAHILEQSDGTPGHTGLGLGVVNKRIRILFGEEYGLSVDSEQGAGTCVKMTLPLIH